MDDPITTGATEGFGLMFYNARMYDPVIGRFTSADTIVPSGVQGLDRYAYVSNNPIRYTDPSGHMKYEGNDGKQGMNCKKNSTYCDSHGKPYSAAILALMRGPVKDICFACKPSPVLELPPDYTLSQQNQPTSSSSNNNLEPLILFWDKIAKPLADGIDVYDVYRFSSSGGWHYAKAGLNVSPIEGVISGVAQHYRDSWNENMSPVQKSVRILIAGGEAFTTDKYSSLVGDAMAVAGLEAAGPAGAVAGKIVGNAFGTDQAESFWSEVINPLLSQTWLGVFP